jgi:hypothetical protein
VTERRRGIQVVKQSFASVFGALILFVCSTTLSWSTAIRFGNDKIELPDQFVLSIEANGDLVLNVPKDMQNPLEDLKRRTDLFESLAKQSQSKADQLQTELSKLEGWKRDRNAILSWIKGIAAGVFITILLGIIVFVYKTREFSGMRDSDGAEANVSREERIRVELLDFYWRLDKFCRRSLIPCLVASFLPALVVAAVVVQHPTFADIVKSDSPFWPIVASIGTPLVFFLTVSAGVHERLSKYLAHNPPTQ